MSASPPPPPRHTWEPLVGLALAEDLGPGDVTSALVIPESLEGEAVIEARAPLVACGLFVAAAVFEALRAGLEVEPLRAEGEHAAAGEPLVRVRGRVRAILAGERTALNFVGRLCGIATFTRRCVEAAAGSGALLLDTRKTLPGWRSLDKYATAVGGARNHRSGLYDGILIKDNHLAAAGGVALAVKAARAGAPPHLKIEVEVESLADALAAVEAGADALLLDNRSPAELRAIAERLRSRVWLEASGGVTLASLREVAQSGVHAVSLGALTHSAPAADVALELTPGGVGR